MVGMRNAEIDWLRGVAILMVIWDHVGEPFHPWVPPLFRGAHSVIDFFFVLSGYLAARSFLPTLPEFPSAASGWTRLKGTLPAIRSFLGRRFIRLFPMAVLWAVLPWGISWLLGPSRIFGDADAIGREVLAIVTFRYNYAIPFGLSNWLGHYWSLSIQEH